MASRQGASLVEAGCVSAESPSHLDSNPASSNLWCDAPTLRGKYGMEDFLARRSVRASPSQREFFIDNLLQIHFIQIHFIQIHFIQIHLMPSPPASSYSPLQIHFIIVMIRWTGLAPWELEFLFPGSRACSFLEPFW